MSTIDFLRTDGVQNFIHPLLAPISEPQIIINYLSRPLRAKVRRTGYSLFLDNPDSAHGYGLIAVTLNKVTVSGKVSYAFRFSGNHIYAYVIGSGATSWGLPIYTFANDPEGVDLDKYVNALFVASHSGNNPMIYIRHNPTTDVLEVVEETADEAPLNPTCLAVYANALFTDDGEAPGRMRRSSIGYGGTPPDLGSAVVPFDGGQWMQNDNDDATARFYDVSPYTNGTIVGLKNINNRMVIFLGSDVGDMGMYRYDFNSLVQIPTTTSIRPDGQNTIVLSEDGSANFANNYGIYNFTGDKPRRVSQALGPDSENIQPGAAVEFENLYMLALNSSRTIERSGQKFILDNPVIVRDMIADELVWWDTAHRMTGFAKFSLSSDDQLLLYSIDEDGNTWVWDNANTDGGQVISGVIMSREFIGKTITKPMDATALYVVCHNPGGQNVKVKSHEDDSFGTETTLVDDMQMIGLDGAAYTRGLTMLITCDTNGSPPDFYGHAFDFREEAKPSGSGLQSS